MDWKTNPSLSHNEESIRVDGIYSVSSMFWTAHLIIWDDDRKSTDRSTVISAEQSKGFFERSTSVRDWAKVWENIAVQSFTMYLAECCTSLLSLPFYDRFSDSFVSSEDSNTVTYYPLVIASNFQRIRSFDRAGSYNQLTCLMFSSPRSWPDDERGPIPGCTLPTFYLLRQVDKVSGQTEVVKVYFESYHGWNPHE